MQTKQKIILAGGSGFLGTMLGQDLLRNGYDVVVLTRRPMPGTTSIRPVVWDGKTMGGWVTLLEGAAAVVNLAGRSVNCRYDARNRRLILESRIDSTRVLGEAISRCDRPPPVWLNSSTATIYKHSFHPMDEATGEIGATPEAKDAFSVYVARSWEQVLDHAQTPETRKVALRTAMVLGTGKGSVFRVLRRLARLGLGGRMAEGTQYVSWIHEEDFCRAIRSLINNKDLRGPVNLAAPHPVTNDDLMRLLRKVCGAPLGMGLPATRWMLECGALLLRTETELILKSRCVVPSRLLAAGFEFRFPHLQEALRELESRLCRPERRVT